MAQIKEGQFFLEEEAVLANDRRPGLRFSV